MTDITPILVIPPRIYAEQKAVHDAWRKRGWTVRQVASLSAPLDVPRERAKLYGDYEFCVVVARGLGLELVVPPDDFLLALPGKLVKREVVGCTLAEVGQGRFPRFVKPLAPKLFPGRVYQSGKALDRETQALVEETPVLAADAVTFTAEARCLVLRGEVLSVGIYEGTGSASDATAFARKVVGSCPATRTYVLDVGYIAERGWAIVEANAVWGAGLNGCDPERMVDCVVEETRLG